MYNYIEAPWSHFVIIPSPTATYSLSLCGLIQQRQQLNPTLTIPFIKGGSFSRPSCKDLDPLHFTTTEEGGQEKGQIRLIQLSIIAHETKCPFSINPLTLYTPSGYSFNKSAPGHMVCTRTRPLPSIVH